MYYTAAEAEAEGRQAETLNLVSDILNTTGGIMLGHLISVPCGSALAVALA
jgi:hypothetical protein